MREKSQGDLKPQGAEMAKTGRPSKYNKKIADEICRRLAGGESLRKIIKDEKFPTRSTVHRWLIEPKNEQFRDHYAQARSFYADEMFDECLEIADYAAQDTFVDANGNTKTDWEVVGRSKVRIDTRKWILGRMDPKKYGDKSVDPDEKQLPTQIILVRGPDRKPRDEQ